MMKLEPDPRSRAATERPEIAAWLARRLARPATPSMRDLPPGW